MFWGKSLLWAFRNHSKEITVNKTEKLYHLKSGSLRCRRTSYSYKIDSIPMIPKDTIFISKQGFRFVYLFHIHQATSIYSRPRAQGWVASPFDVDHSVGWVVEVNKDIERVLAGSRQLCKGRKRSSPVLIWKHALPHGTGRQMREWTVEGVPA